MIKKVFTLSLFLLMMSCGGVELVLKGNVWSNNIKDRVMIIMEGREEQKLASELYSLFGNNITEYEYILITSFSEKKENSIIKKNQVAQKTNYELEIVYDLFFENKSCKIFNKKITTRFSILSKSSGYNFGADRSFEELYTGSIRQNIQKFIDFVPSDTTCLKNENQT
tara:strand:+ start:65 stop:568 length:504 start_codon:yes stop_codon:yes gene_type:complete